MTSSAIKSTGDNTYSSILRAEIGQTPELAANFIAKSDAALRALADELKQKTFSYVVICGRGSSGHVGVYLRYLIETLLGYGVSAAAPSVITGYKTTPKVKDALFIVISQSGRSPDLVAATKAARAAGAITLAIVNDANSPAAQACHHVIPILAGEERAVAATKTVINSMIAGALLVAHMADDKNLLDGLLRLPNRLQSAQALDWSTWGASLKTATTAFVTGRGHGFGVIREIALKMTETLAIPVLAYSSAELKHGPRAALNASTPVLALRQNDEVSGSIDDLVTELKSAGVPTHMCGGSGDLPWIGDDHAACDPIAMLIPAYLEIEREARRRGLDPDKPVGLKKVTETL